MKAHAKSSVGECSILHLLPRWILPSPCPDSDGVAFFAGAALAVLDAALGAPPAAFPGALLRDRQALEAAVACLKLEGRNDSAASTRDAVCLARSGEAPGPAGEMFIAWRKMARVNLRAPVWRSQVLTLLPDQVADAFQEFSPQNGSPGAQAGQILVKTLRRFPRQERAAFMLADVTLARAVGWDRPVPVFAAHLKRADLRAIADGQGDPVLRVQSALIAACDTALRSSADLSRRAAKLQGIAPRLRAKGEAEALALFLSHDAVSPSAMLSPRIQGTAFAMSDRAARRLCDRLVALGAVRELTGRATFRLYGL